MPKGIFAVITGNGKGKTTSGLGHVARALGHGKKVCVIQFIKGGWPTGEERFYSHMEGVDFHVMGRGFTWKSDDIEKDIALAKEGWALACQAMAKKDYDLVVLDELTYLMHYKMLEEEAVVEAIVSRPPELHVIVTGRYAGKALMDAADLVTEMQEVKHPYKSGIKAQAGFDF